MGRSVTRARPYRRKGFPFQFMQQESKALSPFIAEQSALYRWKMFAHECYLPPELYPASVKLFREFWSQDVS